MSQQDGFFTFIAERHIKAWTSPKELEQLYNQTVSEVGEEPGSRGLLVKARLGVKVCNLVLSKRGLPTLASQDGKKEFSIESLCFLARFVGMTFEATNGADNCGVVMEEAMLFADRRDALQPPQRPRKPRSDIPSRDFVDAMVRIQDELGEISGQKVQQRLRRLFPEELRAKKRSEDYPSEGALRNYRSKRDKNPDWPPRP